MGEFKLTKKIKNVLTHLTHHEQLAALQANRAETRHFASKDRSHV